METYPYTPLKINMEHNHGGLEDYDIFQKNLKNRRFVGSKISKVPS